MPRIRTVKPEHWSDKELPKITLQAHLLWIGTWNFSDDKGVFENDPLLIRSQIFPRRTDIRVEQIVAWLDQLVKARYIIPFDYKGQGYYINRTFDTHQRIDKPQPSKVSDSILGIILERSENDIGTLQPDSKGEDSRGEEEEGIEADKPPPEQKKKFVKPTKEQLTNYFTSLKLDDFTAGAQAAKFLDHYESVGWNVGRTGTMKNWEASARGWRGRMNDFKKQTNGTHITGTNAGTRAANAAAFLNSAKMDYEHVAGRTKDPDS